MSRTPRYVALLSLVAALGTGCTGNVAVKDVQGDKLGYLTKTFTLKSVPADPAKAVTARDPGPLPFHKMTLSLTPKFVHTSSATPPEYHLRWTLINAGGPFVQYLQEQNSNGIDTRQDYGISYRNILAMRAQDMQLDHTESTFIMEMKSVDSFAPLVLDGSGSGDFDLHYSWGNPIQIANLAHVALHCTYAGRYPASKINAKFAGDAQDLKCDRMNRNGVIETHTIDTLLVHYGVTIRTRSESASATILFQYDDVTIE